MGTKEKREKSSGRPKDAEWDDWDDQSDEEESFPRMSFLEHLDELRVRLFRIVLILLLAVIVCWNFVDPLWTVLELPARRMLAEAQEKSLSLTQRAEQLTLEIKELPPLPDELKDDPKFEKFRGYVNDHLTGAGKELEERIRDILVAKDAKLMQTAIGEAFFLKVKISFLAGLILGFPLLAFQVWAFVAPGLYRRERRLALPFIFFATLFFVGGCLFGYFVAVPFAGSFLMSFGTEFVQLITINKYMDFLLAMMLGLGVVFEIPMVIFLLAKVGIATPRWLLKNFRYAVLVIVIVAAIITPTGDPVNLAIFSIPMILLYLLGIAVAAIWGSKRKEEGEEEELEDEDLEEDEEEESEGEEVGGDDEDEPEDVESPADPDPAESKDGSADGPSDDFDPTDPYGFGKEEGGG
jgi:sec-independent protein translocase protein TatC